jgi:NAD(P)-dependent dehydrogenase (short-subunit alcohol dehydrogenase family)
MNELDFSGKQALVVGGSSGIGNGIAQGFRDMAGAALFLASPLSSYIGQTLVVDGGLIL